MGFPACYGVDLSTTNNRVLENGVPPAVRVPVGLVTLVKSPPWLGAELKAAVKYIQYDQITAYVWVCLCV